MFNESISSTVFTSSMAEEFFENINGDYQFGDASMLTVMRAILYPRIGEDSIRLHTYNFSSPGIFERLMNALSPNTLNFVIIDEGYFQGWDETLHEHFDNEDPNYQNWEKVEGVEAFLKANKFKARVVINREDKTTVIFAYKPDCKMVHLVAGLLPALVPWYFDGSPINDEEKAVLVALGEKTPGKFTDAITKMFMSFNFRDEYIKRKLKGFEAIGQKSELRRIENKINNVNDEIENISQQYQTLLQELRKLRATEYGLNQFISDGENETGIMDYFLRNKNVNVKNLSSRGALTFYTTGYCTSYNADFMEKAVENERSFFYSYCTNAFNAGEMHDLLKAIFVDEEIKLRFCAAYVFDPSDDYEPARAVGGFDFPPECDTYMPNPHIQEFSCLGDYRQYIYEFLRNANYIGAIEQCIESSKSINLQERPTIERFVRRIANDSTVKRCYELPNGECVTAKEAVKYIRAKKEG